MGGHHSVMVPVQDGLGEGVQCMPTGPWGPAPTALSAWLDCGERGTSDGSLFHVM